jgi:hypothetical protein
MSHRISPEHPLRELFRRAVNESFREHRDLYSPDVATHIADELLPDFVHVDRIYRLRNARGKRLEDLPEMLAVAHDKEGPERTLEVNRYIGDFVLFMCGFFPNLVRRGGWITPTPMIARVGGILVEFREPLDYFTAEGRNAYERAARTARLFDPTVHRTYERLGAKIEGYLRLLGRAKSYMEKRPEFPDIEGIIA